MKLVLASTSKFKNEILAKVGLNHSQMNSDFEKLSPNKDNVYQYVKDYHMVKQKVLKRK